MEEALAYSRMLMRRLDDEQETYDEVYNIMRSYKRRMIDSASVASRIQSLLHGKNDLILGFNRFLPKDHETSPSMASDNVVCNDLLQFQNPLSKSAPWWSNFSAKTVDEDHDHHENVQKFCEKSIAGKKSAVEFINLVRESLNDDEMYKEFLRSMVKYKRIKNLDKVEQNASVLFMGSPEVYAGFTAFLADAISKESRSASREANHRLLPRPEKNGSKKLEMKVESLDERIRNRLEDDMHEQDVLLTRLESTMEALERLRRACPTETKCDEINPTEKSCLDFYAYKWNEENSSERRCDEINSTEGMARDKNTTQGKCIKVEDHLSVINLRCIERLYGESGLEMLDILRENPNDASSLILSRLRKKFDELKEIRSQVNRLRANAIKKLYGKAYDPQIDKQSQ